MKHLISILSLFFTLQQSSAQNVDSLHRKMVGTWELINYLSTNNGTGNESPDKIKRVKVMTLSNFSLSLYDVKSKKLSGKITGSYGLSAAKINDFTYQEKVISATPELDPTQSKLIKKSVSIDEADRMIFIWTNNFITYTEIWSRLPEEKHQAASKAN
ncbi:MAG: hypothetical protein WKF66_03610 [Pedobacter sp.]